MSNVEILYNLLKETFILLDDGDRRIFHRYNLSPPRFYALLHISEEPGLSSSALSDRLLCDKSNVTRIVKGLENSGFIERRPHESDRRTLRLFLTGKGQEICNQVREAHTAYNAERLKTIADIANGSIVDNLMTLNQSLQTSLATLKPMNNGQIQE